jgi:hypothetical protein
MGGACSTQSRAEKLVHSEAGEILPLGIYRQV